MASPLGRLLARSPWRPLARPSLSLAAAATRASASRRRALLLHRGLAASASAQPQGRHQREAYPLERLRNVGIIAHIDAGMSTGLHSADIAQRQTKSFVRLTD